ncbi:MAG: hypothetical protein AB1374_11980 [Bacillota bacterium]
MESMTTPDKDSAGEDTWKESKAKAARAVTESLKAAWQREKGSDAPPSPWDSWEDVQGKVEAAFENAQEARKGGQEAMEGDREAFLERARSFEPEKPLLALAIADVDQIQPYVFESAKIPEMRGASELINQLGDEGLKDVLKAKGLPEEVIIYHRGGGAMFLAPLAQAEEVCAALEEKYLRKTLIASITAVHLPVRLRQLLRSKDFQQIRNELIHRLQIRKLQKPSPVHFEWLPVARRCQACHIRPATGVYTESADQPELCEACWKKRREGQEAKLPSGFISYLKRYQEKYGRQAPYLETIMADKKAVPDEDDINKIRRAETLEELSSNGYVGVIAADGDSVGGILPRLNSLAEYVHFSRKLYDLSTGCVYESLATVLRAGRKEQPDGGEKRCFHPFELVALGGDDLFLILPAKSALAMVQEITRRWEEGRAGIIPPGRNDLPPPTLSFGLLICPHTLPLYFMHQLSQQLLRHAKSTRLKKKLQNKADGLPGYIDFLFLKSSGVPRTDAVQMQKVLYEYKHESEPRVRLRLTERPYPLEAFHDLVRTAGALKQAGLTRTQRHSLARSLRLGRFRSTMDVMLYWARRPRDEKGEEIRTAFGKWIERLQGGSSGQSGVQSGGQLVFPWREEKRGGQALWTTQLLDVLELMEWVEVSMTDAASNNGNLGAGNAS